MPDWTPGQRVRYAREFSIGPYKGSVHYDGTVVEGDCPDHCILVRWDDDPCGDPEIVRVYDPRLSLLTDEED